MQLLLLKTMPNVKIRRFFSHTCSSGCWRGAYCGRSSHIGTVCDGHSSFDWNIFFILDANFPHNTANLKQICVSSKLTRHENNHLPKVWAPIIAALSLTERSKLVLKKSTVSSPLVTVFKCVLFGWIISTFPPTFSSLFLKIVLELWKRFWRGRLSGAVDCKHPNQIRILRWSNIVAEHHKNLT